MNRPVDIVVTGFVRNAELAAQSFETPRRLKQEGIVRAVRYVTWDSPELDAFVAPVLAMPDVAVTRVRQPEAGGNANQKGVVYQVRNLEAALAQVAEDDAMVVKSRPDVVFDADFLRAKIRDFDRLCRIDAAATAFGVKLRRAPFFRKIWLPWADANQPFFFEDAAFAGLKRDLAHLVTPASGAALAVLDDPACGPFAHVVRYAAIFAKRFPIFDRYVANYGAFANDVAYRATLLPMLLDDAFFWHLIVANAWILHSAFHIDAGRDGDIRFYPNAANPPSAWTDRKALKLAAPYDDLAGWRANTKAGIEVWAGAARRYGRLVDDAWPRALFTQNFADIPVSMLGQLAQGIAQYETGVLRGLEDAFYDKLIRHHRMHWPAAKAA
jgi:hypothetical protein